VPLAIINHFKPTRELPGLKQLHELYPLGTENKDFRLPRDERFFSWRNFFLTGDQVLKALHPLGFRPMRQRALEVAERWMLERPGPAPDPSLIATCALNAVGDLPGPTCVSKLIR